MSGETKAEEVKCSLGVDAIERIPYPHIRGSTA
ncbi:hypothetical protein GNI_170130 [Gregarina niphandrodes]|uniref:Uncharacterized protein n=1 Tax=Gregarina niphandrodes TaxID=110365 RepID=A0A023AXV3_GRENI|nr:hypothetical protein GNI_170130 [Gregarina niphandrodes]EZG43486.1 hypothetical protein GNI_170130 [Gregarina niphandrodes]|eukprot:XP_011133285.1 hypothetical protein GNI_170130 [Gregarina niphandrodes]